MTSPAVRPPSAVTVNVLIVDDHPENRAALRAILSSPDYELIEASSGAEALLRLLETEFAVLLIDVVMPGMDGFELAAAIKERERTAAVPIVFLTSHTMDADVVSKGYRVGAVDYLIKPLVPEMVRAKVAVFAELYQERKRTEQQSVHLLEAQRRENELRLVELRLAGERRYRILAEAIPHIVWTARPDGAVDYFNRRWFEYTGLSVERAAGAWQGAIHPDDRRRCESGWREALGSGRMFQAECRLRSADGTFRWHLCRAVPEAGSTGTILAWLGTFTDIEEQKRVQAILTEFKATLDAEPDAVMMFAPSDGHMTYVNEGASRLLGQPTDELLRKRPVDLMGEYDAESFSTLLAPLIGGGAESAIMLETSLCRSESDARPIEVSVQYLRIGPDRVVAIARDITERKRTQLERELLYQQAVDAIRVRDEFLSVASHELRTPIASLQLQVEMLLRPPRSAPGAELRREQVRAKLEMAFRQIERLSRLVSELMDVSRITAGRLVLEREEIELTQVIREIVGRLEGDAARAQCPVQLDVGTAVVGTWDRVRFEQVVTNLLTNAFKFGAGNVVELSTRDDGPMVRLVVRDHGIGIASEDIERIFQRYEQAISSKAFGGLGLGLYISRQIVEAHGGTIHVESKPGDGATFTVELPKQPPTKTKESHPGNGRPQATQDAGAS